MAKWTVMAKKADFNEIASHFGIDPVVARLIRNRDIITYEEINNFLHGKIEDIFDPYLLKDMDKAVDIITDALSEGIKIRIIGDYDVDGVTSTAILLKTLTFLEGEADYAIPNRISDGYGVNVSLVDKAKADRVGLIITCDNGIAAADALEHAKALGMMVVVTDHHEVPFSMEGEEKKYIYPLVDAIINPKSHDSTYPYKSICGAFVAFKLSLALLDSLGATKDAITLIEELRELAALGTVCDVMELKSENRLLLKYIMKRPAKSMVNIGLKALMKVCEIEDKPVNYHTFGFIIGPCINATGRLWDASVSLELLMAKDMEEAVTFAVKLKQLNETRKAMTLEGEKMALELALTQSTEKVLVLYISELHESLAGIVAGRIRERFYKPVFIITDSEDGLKGSGRSIEGYHMYEALSKCKELFSKFGGHAMAAGLSMPRENLESFRRKINDNCSLGEDDFQEKIKIDIPMPLSYVTIPLINQISLLEPFGAGNPKPIFAQKDAYIHSIKTMGRDNSMAKLNISLEGGGSFEGVLFRGLEEFEDIIREKYGQAKLTDLLNGTESLPQVKMDLIYTPDINEYRGVSKIQFIINNFK